MQLRRMSFASKLCVIPLPTIINLFCEYFGHLQMGCLANIKFLIPANVTEMSKKFRMTRRGGRRSYEKNVDPLGQIDAGGVLFILWVSV